MPKLGAVAAVIGVANATGISLGCARNVDVFRAHTSRPTKNRQEDLVGNRTTMLTRNSFSRPPSPGSAWSSRQGMLLLQSNDVFLNTADSTA